MNDWAVEWAEAPCREWAEAVEWPSPEAGGVLGSGYLGVSCLVRAGRALAHAMADAGVILCKSPHCSSRGHDRTGLGGLAALPIAIACMQVHLLLAPAPPSSYSL